jgi:hypothetical protein
VAKHAKCVPVLEGPVAKQAVTAVYFVQLGTDRTTLGACAQDLKVAAVHGKIYLPNAWCASLAWSRKSVRSNAV